MSEFGKGFVYNLILFASHFERKICELEGVADYGLWFNGASDHLFELEIPEKWKNTEIGLKAKELKDLALDIGHGDKMMIRDNYKSEFIASINLTKEIGLLIDKELGVNPIKGDYE